jgi:D-cysteine desulfhydrase
MATFHIADRVQGLGKKINPVVLISEPTPVHSLEKFGLVYGNPNLMVKREDQTESTYGGNKVRNLEFILGDALHKKQNKIITLIPYGSNFTGAYAAQSRRLGLEAELSQFVVIRNPQIEAHVDFGRRQGAKMTTFTGKTGIALAAAYANYKRFSSYFVAPGASSVLGVLGHANAYLEMAGQVSQVPERIIVGAGTCGTISGLIVGSILSGQGTKITGVRCAEPLVCNRRRVANLVNQTFKFLEVPYRISPSEVDIQNAPGNVSYALPLRDSVHLMEEFEGLEGIRLDSTYTVKVIAYLKNALQRGTHNSEKLMYWHTYSPAAVLSVESAQAKEGLC